MGYNSASLIKDSQFAEQYKTLPRSPVLRTVGKTKYTKVTLEYPEKSEFLGPFPHFFTKTDIERYEHVSTDR